jgi:hypothetical protein
MPAARADGDRRGTPLADAKRDTSRLDGYVWHSLRHTCASRLAVADVDRRPLVGAELTEFVDDGWRPGRKWR